MSSQAEIGPSRIKYPAETWDPPENDRHTPRTTTESSSTRRAAQCIHACTAFEGLLL